AAELRGLDGYAGVRCQRAERILVANREYAGPLVQYLESPDNLAHLVPHRHRQHGARAVAGLAVDAAIKARIAVGIFHVDGVTSEGGVSGNSEAGVEPENFVTAKPHLGPH